MGEEGEEVGLQGRQEEARAAGQGAAGSSPVAYLSPTPRRLHVLISDLHIGCKGAGGQGVQRGAQLRGQKSKPGGGSPREHSRQRGAGRCRQPASAPMMGYPLCIQPPPISTSVWMRCG